MSWLSRKAIIIILSWIDLSSLGLLTWEDYSDVTMPYYTGTWCLFVRPYGDGMTACTEDDYCRDCSLIDSISEQQAINEIFPNNISILPADVKRSLQNTQQPSADGYVLNITPNQGCILTFFTTLAKFTSCLKYTRIPSYIYMYICWFLM